MEMEKLFIMMEQFIKDNSTIIVEKVTELNSEQMVEDMKETEKEVKKTEKGCIFEEMEGLYKANSWKILYKDSEFTRDQTEAKYKDIEKIETHIDKEFFIKLI